MGFRLFGRGHLFLYPVCKGERRINLIYFKCTRYSTIPQKTRYNEVNIQMLSPHLHGQLFPTEHRSTSSIQGKNNSTIVELSKMHLKMHKIPVEERRASKPEIDLELPSLLDSSIDKHFYKVGRIVGGSYQNLVESFVYKMLHSQDNFVTLPGEWSRRHGWTKYTLEGKEVGLVKYPIDKVMIFDVETCVSAGPWPQFAIAMSDTFIYSWVSPHLFSDPTTDNTEVSPRLIDFGPDDQESILIGHHVSYDRARILQEYKLKKGKRRFLDTLSMHCAVAGISSQQRKSWMKHTNEAASDDTDYSTCEPPVHIAYDGKENKEPLKWLDLGAMNNLKAAYGLHCQSELDKSPVEILIKGSLEDVKASFNDLMTYCARDVLATKDLFLALWPKYLNKCPNPVTFSAILEMGTCFLPVNEQWDAYVENTEKLYLSAVEEINKLLVDLVETVAIEGYKDDLYKTDIWLSKLDWTPVPAKYTKERRKADGSFAKGGEPRPIGDATLFGRPAWYKKLYSHSLKKPVITSKTRILPYLMRMKWDGQPVHFIDDDGWCYSNVKGEIHENGQRYTKIPHHETEGANVGSLMTKHHLKFYEAGRLSSESPIVKEVMKISAKFSFWVGYRERIRDQFVIKEGEVGVDLGYTSGSKAGMCLPGMMTMGTVTRRAVEPTWMTATNPKGNRAGSELKAKIIAPDGYTFIGADVDSQELWISSLLGDAQFGFAGATALGWMTLQGGKADNTDLHSRTASILGMSRDDAKIFNYGRIYGAGVTFAAKLMQKFNPTITADQAKIKAEELYKATKGKKVRTFDRYNSFYCGGTETFMFNVLENIAKAEISRTPALGCAISDALLSANVSHEYITSRVNWAVQSSGVDYLHMLVTTMAYLLKVYRIDARLALTIHDEVRYLVTKQDQYRAALALQIANIWTRAMFAYRVGMRDLPLSVAFFSAVDFDHVLRKEVNMDCVTPSNPTKVANGFTLDIYKLLEMVPGGLGCPDPMIIIKDEMRIFEVTPSVTGKSSIPKLCSQVTQEESLLEPFNDDDNKKSKVVIADNYRPPNIKNSHTAKTFSSMAKKFTSTIEGGGKNNNRDNDHDDPLAN